MNPKKLNRWILAVLLTVLSGTVISQVYNPIPVIIAALKTFTVNNTLTLAGTDGTTLTFPTTSATIARTDAAQSFTGVQTFGSTVSGNISGNAVTTTGFQTATGSGSVTLTGGSIATASTTLVDLTGATVTFTTGANRAVCGFSAMASNTIANNNTWTLNVDGTLYMGTSGNGGTFSTANFNNNISFTVMTPALTAASHTFKIQWLVQSGTGTVTASSASPAHFWCYEIR